MPRTSSKDLASIATMELSHALQHPDPAAPFIQIGTAQLKAMRQLSDIFSVALPSRTTPPASPSSLNPSQVGTTVRRGPADQTPIPPQQVQTPIGSPSLTPRRSQRINPSQVPSPRVTPRFHSSGVAPTRVHTPLPPTTVIPITPHPASINAPYMPQGIAGVNLFNTFEEEHTTPTSHGTTRAPLRANTLPIRPRRFALGSSALLSFRPAKQCPNTWTIKSSMKRLAPALNIATSSTMLAPSLSGMKPLQMSLADWRNALVTALTARTQFSLSHAKPSQKEKLLPTDRSSSTFVPINMKSTGSASL
jgi:hypothetical protein